MKFHLGQRDRRIFSFQPGTWISQFAVGFGCVIALLGGGVVHAQAPSVLSHIGFVEVNAVPFHGEGRFKFALVRGATSLWSHDGTSVAGSEPTGWVITNLVHGRYSMPLGDTNVASMTVPIPPSAVNTTNVFLRVWFNNGVLGFQRLVPDQPLLSVPYALRSTTVADNAVGSQQLAPGAVQTPNLADGSVTSAKILNSTILSIDIADATIATGDIADGAITSPKILDGTIVSADIADGTITGADLLNGTVASADIADSTIASADILDGTLTLSDFSLASVDTRYVLKAGDTMTGKLTASGGIATSSITNNAAILSLISRGDIELTIDNGGGVSSAFEIFNSAGTHLYLLSEGGNAQTFGSHTVTGDQIVLGNLGVGTSLFDANAVVQIDLPSSTATPHLRIKSALSDNGFGIQFANPTETWLVGPNIGNWNDNRFSILADSTKRGMVVAPNGNVGIASVSAAAPFTALTIDGSIGFSTVSTPAMYVYPGGVDNAEKPVIVHSPEYPQWGLFYRDAGDRFIMKSSAADTSPSLVVDLGNNWVAIGTETPKVGYELSVDGQIVCEELLVENSTDWPDYVFQEDYRLQPLEEVEAHIKERKHLPGIPTAAEISKNGLPIGEMQKRMMEKIEELTLHLIDQNKRMASQDKRIGQLEAELRVRTSVASVEEGR